MKTLLLKESFLFTIKDGCKNKELKEWCELNNKQILKAKTVEVFSKIVTIEDCPYTVNYEEIKKMDFEQALRNYILKKITSRVIDDEYNKGKLKAGELVLGFFNKTNNMDYTKIFIEHLVDLVDSNLFLNAEIKTSNSILGCKETLKRILTFIDSMKEEDFFSKWEEEITNI